MTTPGDVSTEVVPPLARISPVPDPLTLELAAIEAGRHAQAAAYHRLGLLSDLGECFAAEKIDEAFEVKEFTSRWLARLANSDGQFPLEECASQLIVESTSRWGEYLADLETESSRETLENDDWSEPAPSAFEEEGPAAIDTTELLRLLTSRSANETERAALPTTKPEPLERVREPYEPGRPDSGHEALAIDPALRDVFLEEGTELFDRVKGLVLCYGHHQTRETLGEIGRCLHTLKGAAGSVGLSALSARIHGIEDQITVAPEDRNRLNAAFHDLLRELDQTFETLRNAGPREGVSSQVAYSECCATDPSQSSRVVPQLADPLGPACDAREKVADPAWPPTRISESIRVASAVVDELSDLISEGLAERFSWSTKTHGLTEFAPSLRSGFGSLEGALDRVRSLALEASGSPDQSSRRDELITALDRLEERARDIALQCQSLLGLGSSLCECVESAVRLTTRLGDSIQGLRVVPAAGLFQRLTRVAEDAARVEGREIVVVLTGGDTTIDRPLLERAYEPLLHVVRNAVSHGIEPPDERINAGKPRVGRVSLSASRLSHSVLLTVEDDGQGLDRAAILAKGRRLRLIGPDEIPTDNQLDALIFQPSFSTRDSANTVAGRGVGMDVVSREVGRLNGTVEIESTRGEGTKVTLRLPARLSLQHLIVFRIAGTAFALPLDAVSSVEIAQPGGIVGRGFTRQFRCHDELWQLADRGHALGIVNPDPPACPMLLLVRAAGARVALEIDGVVGAGEHAIKPLATILSGHPIVTGTSLTPAGEVIVTLNPCMIVSHGGWGVGIESRKDESHKEPQPPSILLVDDSVSVRRSVGRHLHLLGCRVIEASNGIEALACLRKEDFSLILTDLEMPRMAGLEFLAELQRSGVLSRVPVIVSSTRSDEETVARVMKSGATRFLAKPIDREILARTIQELFEAFIPGEVRPRVPVKS